MSPSSRSIIPDEAIALLRPVSAGFPKMVGIAELRGSTLGSDHVDRHRMAREAKR